MLTDTKARTAKPQGRPYKLRDSHGLYLEVKPTGAKLWRYRYKIAGRENVFALGVYPDVGLAEARSLRDEARKVVKQGIHPSHARREERLRATFEAAQSFEAIALEWVEAKRTRWSEGYHRQCVDTLRRDVLPFLGTLPIRQISPAHVLQVLKRIESRGSQAVALQTRQWIGAVSRHAIATLRSEVDPTLALKDAVHRLPPKEKAPLSPEEIPTFIDALEAYRGSRITAIALHLLLLTFVRPSELREAEWSELDLDKSLWRIPASRMKMKEEHIVPLSHQAITLLRELQGITGQWRYLFPNTRDLHRPMQITTLNHALSYMGYGDRLTAHGFRSTASTLLHEMGYRPDVIERQLAHKEPNTIRRAYNKAQYLEERKTMMTHWADYLDGLREGGVVVPTRAA